MPAPRLWRLQRKPEACEPLAGGRAPATPPVSEPTNTTHPERVPAAAVMPSTYLSLHYHLVFSTKDRTPLIEASWRNRLHEYLGGTVEGLKGFPQEVGGMADHVHLLVGLKATYCLAEFIRELKKASSSWVHGEIGMPFCLAGRLCTINRECFIPNGGAKQHCKSGRGSSQEDVSGGTRGNAGKGRG